MRKTPENKAVEMPKGGGFGSNDSPDPDPKDDPHQETPKKKDDEEKD